MWDRILRAFDLFRKAWGLRTILDLLGIWKWIALGGAAVLALVVQFWAYMSRLSPPVVAVLGLAACVLLLILVRFGVAFWRVGKTQDSPEGLWSPQKGRPSGFVIACACVLGVLAIIGFFTKRNPAPRVASQGEKQLAGLLPGTEEPLTGAFPQDARRLRRKRAAETSKATTTLPDSVLPKQEAASTLQALPAYGVQHIAAGGTGYQANGPGAHVDVNPPPPPAIVKVTLGEVSNRPYVFHGRTLYTSIYIVEVAAVPIPILSITAIGPLLARVQCGQKKPGTLWGEWYGGSATNGSGSCSMSNAYGRDMDFEVDTIAPIKQEDITISWTCAGIICQK